MSYIRMDFGRSLQGGFFFLTKKHLTKEARKQISCLVCLGEDSPLSQLPNNLVT